MVKIDGTAVRNLPGGAKEARLLTHDGEVVECGDLLARDLGVKTWL